MIVTSGDGVNWIQRQSVATNVPHAMAYGECRFMDPTMTTFDSLRAGCEMTGPAHGMRRILILQIRLLYAFLLMLPPFGAQAGVVFTSIHAFKVFTNSTAPTGLAQGSDGNFYGAAYQGGMNNSGTVFKISPNGALTTLHSLSGVDEWNPNGLVRVARISRPNKAKDFWQFNR